MSFTVASDVIQHHIDSIYFETPDRTHAGVQLGSSFPLNTLFSANLPVNDSKAMFANDANKFGRNL